MDSLTPQTFQPAGATPARARLGAPADPRGAGLLARPAVAVQGAALDGAVDVGDQGAVLDVGARRVALRDRGLQPPEVRLDGRGVAPVLEPLAQRPVDPLFL